MRTNSVFKRLASASCSKLLVIINAMASKTPVSDKIKSRVIWGSSIYRFPKEKENITDMMIKIPMTKNRNCGHCDKGMLYFLHSSPTFIFDKNSRNVIDIVYHTLWKARKNARKGERGVVYRQYACFGSRQTGFNSQHPDPSTSSGSLTPGRRRRALSLPKDYTNYVLRVL